MRGLPGEDRAVNNITETHLRQLFDAGCVQILGPKMPYLNICTWRS